MIMKLLVHRVLRESFSTCPMLEQQTILVYLKLGRQFESFKRGLMRVKLTDCIEKESEREYQKRQRKGERDRKRRHKEDQEREKMGLDS